MIRVNASLSSVRVGGITQASAQLENTSGVDPGTIW